MSTETMFVVVIGTSLVLIIARDFGYPHPRKVWNYAGHRWRELMSRRKRAAFVNQAAADHIYEALDEAQQNGVFTKKEMYKLMLRIGHSAKLPGLLPAVRKTNPLPPAFVKAAINESQASNTNAPVKLPGQESSNKPGNPLQLLFKHRLMHTN